MNMDKALTEALDRALGYLTHLTMAQKLELLSKEQCQLVEYLEREGGAQEAKARLKNDSFFSPERLSVNVRMIAKLLEILHANLIASLCLYADVDVSHWTCFPEFDEERVDSCQELKRHLDYALPDIRVLLEDLGDQGERIIR